MGTDGLTSDRIRESTFLRTLLYIIVTVWVFLGFTKIIMGAIYGSCSEGDLIPAWVIIDAIIPIFHLVGYGIHLRGGTSALMKRIASVSIGLGTIIALVWCILGGVWIYPHWTEHKNQCDMVIKSFSFAMLTVNWSVMWMWTNLSFRLFFC